MLRDLLHVKVRALLFAILLAASAATLIVYYRVIGPGWDLIAHYTNGQSLLRPELYTCLRSPPCGLIGGKLTFWYGTYFEPMRAPVSQAIFAVLYPIFSRFSIEIYVALLFAAYLFALHALGKRFKLDMLMLYAVFLSPYFLYVAIMPNSAELLSLASLLIAVSLLSERSQYAGLFLGISAVSKYPMAIFLPMLLLLLEPKKVAKSVALFAIPVLAWLGLSYLMFRNPLASYGLAFSLAVGRAPFVAISGAAIKAVFGFQAVLLAIAIALALWKRGRVKSDIMAAMKRISGNGIIKSLRTDNGLYRCSIVVVLLAISLAGYWFIARHNDVFTQTRFGYFAAAASSLAVVALLNYASIRIDRRVPLLIASVSISVLLLALLAFNSNARNSIVTSVRNPNFARAASELASLGYGNCRVVTNDWVYMLYYGVNAFPQFYYNRTTMQYPILEFYNGSAATSAAYIMGLGNSTPVYSTANFSILLPRDYRCYS